MKITDVPFGTTDWSAVTPRLRNVLDELRGFPTEDAGILLDVPASVERGVVPRLAREPRVFRAAFATRSDDHPVPALRERTREDDRRAIVAEQ